MKKRTQSGVKRTQKEYPHWVCRDCGLQASGGKSFTVSTYHEAKCEVCGKKKFVTESRDFGHPDFKNIA